MVEFFRGNESSIIRLNIKRILNNVTVYKKNGAYTINEQTRRIPGDMYTIVNNGVLSATLSDKFIREEKTDMQIVIDRAIAKDTLVMEVSQKGVDHEIIVDETYEIVTIRVENGEYVISGEETVEARNEKKLEDKIAALEAAVMDNMPNAIAKAMQAVSDETAANDEKIQKFNSAYAELQRLKNENQELDRKTVDIEAEILKVKGLIDKATLYGRDKAEELDQYQKDLNDLMATLNIDESVLGYYNPEDTRQVMENIEKIKELAGDVDRALSRIIEKKSKSIAELEKKASIS